MIELLSGSFEEGCGVMVYDTETSNYYHLLVLTDKETGKLFIEIKDKKYFENDIVLEK